MFETLDRLVLAGIGALSMTRQRAEEIFEEYVRRGQAQRSGQAHFVEELMSSSERARADLEAIIARQVRQALIEMNLPTREDIARLETKLDRVGAGAK